MRGLLIAAALTGTGLTASDTKELDKALAGRVAGKPVTCLSSARVETPHVISDSILLYRDGAHVWRNDLPESCTGLDDDAIVVTEVYGGQLCRNDRFYTLRRGGGMIPGPHCRLGNFVPWDKVKR